VATTRRRVGGAAILAMALWFGRETVLWAFYKILDFFASKEGGVTLAAVPWQNVAATLLGLIGFGLVVWPSKAGKQASKYDRLVARSQYLVARIRNQRKAHYIRRDLEPLTDVCRDGFSTLVMFAECGFAIPNFQTTEAERIAVGLEHYFATIGPLLRDGHVKMAKEQAPAISERAVAEGAALDMKGWIRYAL
jgi:hypothetical protein